MSDGTIPPVGVATPRLRAGVRALISGPDGRFLLAHLRIAGLLGGAWICPGGGVHPGETDEVALRRELAEETGLTSYTIGPHLWTKTAYASFEDSEGEGYDGQIEKVFAVRSEHLTLNPAMTPSELNAEGLEELRWWRRADIAASSDLFVPRILADLLDQLATAGPPAEPWRLLGH
ncbi:MAG: NUDIX domain-containing protein [Propionibacteriaceae bacterium]|uniref:NUDIX domain-containing protein n=1 Tax=Dietzia sp. UBA5065 TaxID=1946422 RepID=UPI0025BC78E9|nr:NUDIX domain-containing protein [Dietzia sp. UBA5065]MBK9157153.1 NUDIX domain-containing protein [Micropruina sp.]